jgi:hypothetical protein
MQFHSFPITSSLSSYYILLSTQFPYSSFKARWSIFIPIPKAGKIIGLYILIFWISERGLEDEMIPNSMVGSIPPN